MSEQARDFLALTLQERVRRFNLGTPTALHVGTHELVNDLWRELENYTAALEALEECAGDLEAEVNSRYKDSAGQIHPALQTKYWRDMRPVCAARAAIAKATSKA